MDIVREEDETSLADEDEQFVNTRKHLFKPFEQLSVLSMKKNSKNKKNKKIKELQVSFFGEEELTNCESL